MWTTKSTVNLCKLYYFFIKVDIILYFSMFDDLLRQLVPFKLASEARANK